MTNVTIAQYEKAVRILHNAVDTIPLSIESAAVNARYSYRKNIICLQTFLDLLDDWNEISFYYNTLQVSDY